MFGQMFHFPVKNLLDYYFLRTNGGSLGFSEAITFSGGTFYLFNNGSGDWGALECGLRSL